MSPERATILSIVLLFAVGIAVWVMIAIHEFKHRDKYGQRHQ